mmetsp:Transcript_216/g.267  ORF Transcript_216/g.267 Transcript_216/m.267 type:complete len:240 (-) Transcript_216:629-1348(-)
MFKLSLPFLGQCLDEGGESLRITLQSLKFSNELISLFLVFLNNNSKLFKLILRLTLHLCDRLILRVESVRQILRKIGENLRIRLQFLQLFSKVGALLFSQLDMPVYLVQFLSVIRAHGGSCILGRTLTDSASQPSKLPFDLRRSVRDYGNVAHVTEFLFQRCDLLFLTSEILCEGILHIEETLRVGLVAIEGHGNIVALVFALLHLKCHLHEFLLVDVLDSLISFLTQTRLSKVSLSKF